MTTTNIPTHWEEDHFWGKGTVWRKYNWNGGMRGMHARRWEIKTTAKKSSGQRENAHAEEESVQGQHARRPN
jgi:hypothetical protein